MAAEFERSGRLWLRQVVSEADLSLLDRVASAQETAGQRLDPSAALATALSPDSGVVKAIHRVDARATPVRVVAFNKSEDANWGVPWHQDRVIAVAQRAEVRGYRNWSRKSGIWHCEPPQAVLEEMLFVRVHLDDTDLSNGAMEIAVGSHARGCLPAAGAEEVARQYPIELCQAKRGDVLVLKMLVLHSSKPARIQSGRRVLRIDFSSSRLPPPLSWIRYQNR